MRDKEQRASSLGYAPFRIKLAAFVISAAVIGLAGALLTFFMRGVYANPLSWEHAADAVLMSVLGGVHHVLGVVWGAIVFIVLEDQSAVLPNWWLAFAPLLMLIVLVAPEGLQLGVGGQRDADLREQSRRIEVDLVHGFSTNSPLLERDTQRRSLPVGNSAASSFAAYGSDSSRPQAQPHGLHAGAVLQQLAQHVAAQVVAAFSQPTPRAS